MTGKKDYRKLNPKELAALGLPPRSERYIKKGAPLESAATISKRQYQKAVKVGQYNPTIQHRNLKPRSGNIGPTAVGHSRMLYAELRGRGYSEKQINQIKRLRKQATDALNAATADRKNQKKWDVFNKLHDRLNALYPDMPKDFIKY